MSDDHAILNEYGSDGSAEDCLLIARDFLGKGQLSLAASALDRAYGLAPDRPELTQQRGDLLDELAVVECGLRFRYIPAGTFLMGPEDGEKDERPRRAVRTDGYWLSETTVSWAKYCQLMGWSPPPGGFLSGSEAKTLERMARFALIESNKIRLQYCEDTTSRARNWHAHTHGKIVGGAESKSFQEFFGSPQRADPGLPFQYDQKPIVSVSWQDAMELCEKMSHLSTRIEDSGKGKIGKASYRLPSEEEWEKAARGGLLDCRYAWGNEPPAENSCDFNRFDAFSILPSRSFAPNGYGLFAMCGSVWEWTSSRYDAQACSSPNPPVDASGRSPSESVRVLRGGSWADCAEAVTVSFRMPRASQSWREGPSGGHMSPNIGFRICRELVR